MKRKQFRKDEEKTETIEKPEHTFNASKRKRGGKIKSNSGIKPTYRGTNDIHWYATDSQLLQDVGRFSFNLPSGTDVSKLLAAGSDFTQNAADVYRIPGIMSLNVIPTVGISVDATSPVNLASQLIYNKLRVEINGARSYDQTDVMHYLIGADSAFSYYGFLLRLYGVMTNYNFLNKHTPKALVTAMGVNYDSVSANLAQFRAYINMYAKRLSVLVVPTTMPIIERHFKMFTGIYKDSESPKAQFYLYNPSVLHAYNPIDSEAGGGFTDVVMRPKWVSEDSTDATNVLYTVGILQAIGDELLLHLNDEDILNIAGDILKAFGEGGIWKQDFIPDTFAVEPVFDFTWLTQIQNATCLNHRFESNNPIGDTSVTSPYHLAINIPSDGTSPYIVANCYGAVNVDVSVGGTYPLPQNVLLTSPYDSPKPEDIMESTRLTAVIRKHASTAYEVVTCGSEICSSIDIYTYVTKSGIGVLTRMPVRTYVATTTAGDPGIYGYQRYIPQILALVDTFAMHPTIYNIFYKPASGQGTTASYAVLNPFADIDNFCVADEADLASLHEVALLNELFISNVGFVR